MTRRDFLRTTGACAAAYGGIASANGCASLFSRDPARWIIFVTIDTLRADHLACHGYPRQTAPFLDSLASKGILFRNAFASSSHTNPSHVSIFTSLEMPQHRIYTNHQAELDASVFSMAQMLGDVGYDTAAFNAVSFLRIIDRGFETFDTPDSRGDEFKLYRKADATIDRALEWLSSKRAKDRLFLWIHLYEPHCPYTPPDSLRDAMMSLPRDEQDRLTQHWTTVQGKGADTAKWRGDTGVFTESQHLYDAEIAFADRELARLFSYVKQRGPRRNTLWLVTSDHGEGLGSHNYSGHGMYIYNEQIHVPLIMQFSSGAFAGARVSPLVRHVDILPTLASLTGADTTKQVLPIRGRSLMPLIADKERAIVRPWAFSQRRHKLTMKWVADDVYCVQDGVHKFIHRPLGKCQFYDVKRDPYERHNQIGKTTAKQERMHKRAEALFAELTSEGERILGSDLSTENQQELEALGYF